jgi:ribonuclease HI
LLKKGNKKFILKDHVIMYTDGASRGNPGPGGYGTILTWNGIEKILSAGFRRTTNNRMELMAVIAGLEALKKQGIRVEIYSDSQYVVNAVEKRWLENWISTDFKGGKKNKDLWLRYSELASNHRIRFHWVKGHASNPNNERCDELATTAAEGKHLLEDDGYEG